MNWIFIHAKMCFAVFYIFEMIIYEFVVFILVNIIVGWNTQDYFFCPYSVHNIPNLRGYSKHA